MLAALRIESLAIVDTVEVRFDRGLNVLTGETGAGKSILIDALGLLLGGRADPGCIRAGRDEAAVEGLFVGEGLAERARALGLPAEGDELLVRRTLCRAGRGRVHVNGALATVSLLGALTRGLVDLSGQHEHVSLLRRERHLDLLDAFGGALEARAAYEEAWASLAEASAELDRLRAEEDERARRRDYLAFQLQELDEIAPEPGEDARLADERRVLAGAERIRGALAGAEELVASGEDALVDRLVAVERRIEEAARIDASLAPLAQVASTCRVELEELARELRHRLGALGGEPERLLEVDERLEALRRLTRKHGGTIDAALERAASMRAELEAIDRSGARVDELEAAIRERREVAIDRAKRLSALRRAAAVRLAGAACAELASLGLEKAVLRVELSPSPGEGVVASEGVRLGRRGAEEAELVFCPNPGEEARPLARIASGGELSRVLLALKRALAHVDPVESYVFDEIDAGVGGATGLTVGRMLKEVARDRQVLCVTHLPQVAAFADVHLHVSKSIAGGRTRSRVERLDDLEGRTRSLARMLAGTDGPAALAAAAELLAETRGGRRGRPGRARRSKAA
ncbi:MAG TPA: DNA repair protein RecN [Vulgatibacter sp.]|nr:DNA repair protein RecN [Vulgatibacter sp.]